MLNFYTGLKIPRGNTRAGSIPTSETMPMRATVPFGTCGELSTRIAAVRE